MGADHPVLWCKDYKGGRSFYSALGNTLGELPRRRLPPRCSRARSTGPPAWPTRSPATAARPCWPTTSRSRRSPATRTSRSRSASTSCPDGRHHPDLAPRHRCACTTRRPARPRRSRTSAAPSAADDAARLHQLRGRPLRPGRRQQLRPEQLGVPVLRAADGHGRQAVGRLGRHADDAEHDACRTSAPSPTAWDPYVGYFQLSRFKFVEDASGRTPGPRAPSSRSCGSPTTARSAATSRATSTSTSTTTCGWSRVTTRRPAASAPTATARSRTS